MTQSVVYAVGDVAAFINWIYFFHAWGFAPRFASVARQHACAGCRAAWLNSIRAPDRPKAEAAAALYDDAVRMLAELGREWHTYGRFGLFPAWGGGDDIVLRPDGGGRVVLPCLRQQRVARDGDPFLCLADFLRPEGQEADRVGIFAATVDGEMERLYEGDDYRRMLVQTLCDRLAEATTELLHLDIRRTHWGYAPDEDLPLDDLLAERYQGIRPAVGYPSLPDQSIAFVIDEVLQMGEIGIRLTESGAMTPHASVCGLMFAHPAAHYFAVGPIDRQQFEDYARRRGRSPEDMARFLRANYSPQTHGL